MAEQAIYAAFDTETTGLIAGVDKVVEVAAVVFSGDEVIAEHQQLVDPLIPIPAQVQAINNISNEMVRGQPTIEQALPGLLAILAQGVPVAHNAVFDVGFLVPAIRRVGVEPPAGPILDTRGLARAAFPGRQSYSLERLCRELGIEASGPGSVAHRALADAYACMALFRSCTRVLADRGCGSLADLARLSGPALDFGEHAPRQPLFAAELEIARGEGGLAQIEYVSAAGEKTVREIKPLAFGTVGGAPVVRAFCRLRGEERTFRLDCIRGARRLV
jgi:DNA polymerase III epsilon subunit family exonuclease